MAAASSRRFPLPSHVSSVLPTLALFASLLTFSGCATQGPLHVYSVARPTGEPPILDHAPAPARPAEVPSFLEDEDTLLGFAYDPFTDHFFLRLAPGNKIRVVDRPARAIKREFDIENLPAGGDLAIRPRDGHVFFLADQSPQVTETSRLGKVIRTVTLADAPSPHALALDLTQHHLLVLHADGRRITRHALDGKLLSSLTLERPAARSLAYDSERQEFLTPLAAAPGTPAPIAVFDANGKLLRHLDAPAARFVDLGPRSFVRVF